MSSLPSLLAGLPISSSLLTSGMAHLPLYAAQVDGERLSMAVLRQEAPETSRFFLSADRVHFHELGPTENYPHASAVFHPVLALTRGLPPMVLIDDGSSSVQLLKNSPGDEHHVDSAVFLRDPALFLEKGALHAFAGGEAPVLAGGLDRWWKRVLKTPPPSEISIDDTVHVVRMIGHRINNGMMGVLFNAEMIEPVLKALRELTHSMLGSAAVRDALREHLESHPQAKEAFEMLSTPAVQEPQTNDPMPAIHAALEDMEEACRHISSSADKTVAYMHAVHRRVPDELPIALNDAKTLMHEIEFGRTRPADPPPSLPPVSAQNAGIREAVLVVDDEPDVGKSVCKALGQRGFSNMIYATSIAEAIAAAGTLTGLKVVLTDYNLSPKETGLDLARELKKRHPGIQIVFMSGNTRALTNAMTSEEASLHPVHEKPVDIALLAEDLRARLKDSSKT